MILAAPLLILIAVFNIVSGDTDAAVLIVVVPLALAAGIWKTSHPDAGPLDKRRYRGLGSGRYKL